MNKLIHTPKHKLAKKLNELMEEKQLTSHQISAKTQIPQTTIYRLTRNEYSNPTVSILVPLAKFFGITIDELLGVSKT